MKDNFEFFVRIRTRGEVRVVVRRRAVELVDPIRGFLCGGVWDDGGYVRFERSFQVPVHPLILDEIDSELRRRMPSAGEQDARKRQLNKTKRGGRRRPVGAIIDPENLRAVSGGR